MKMSEALTEIEHALSGGKKHLSLLILHILNLLVEILDFRVERINSRGLALDLRSQDLGYVENCQEIMVRASLEQRQSQRSSPRLSALCEIYKLRSTMEILGSHVRTVFTTFGLFKEMRDIGAVTSVKFAQLQKRSTSICSVNFSIAYCLLSACSLQKHAYLTGLFFRELYNN